jgi:hypothetical protein
MSIDKRAYYRIVTDIPCRFGREAKMYHRQVNISAGGAAFVVMPEMVDHFMQGEKTTFAFELNHRHFQFDCIVIRREDRNFQTMAAIQFFDIEHSTQKMFDNMILSMGGYRRDDHDKKREYLAWYAPNALHPHPHMGANASIEQVQEQKQSTLEETALEHQQQVEENDLASLDDLFKEFGQ